MLKYEIRPATTNAETAPVIILMHGRGSNRFDLLGLADHLPKHATLVFPEAPFAAAPWGYGPGSAWYRFLGRNKPEPESFSRSLDELHELITSLNAPRVVVGGFSQGGTLGIACAVAFPGIVHGALNFSGFVADHPRVQVTADTVRGTSFFWGHGRRDANIPFELAIEGRGLLESAGADLTSLDYDIGHWIDPQELSDAVEWLKRIL